MHAPSLRVNPTPTMVIAQNHINVDAKDGRISTPMLNSWSSNLNLVGIFNDALFLFSYPPSSFLSPQNTLLF
jgi:hypothetical protein